MIPALAAALVFVAWVAAVRRERARIVEGAQSLNTSAPSTLFIVAISPRVAAMLDEEAGR